MLSGADSIQMNAWVDSVMATLTPDERLGQLIMPIVESKDEEAYRQIVRRDLQQYHVGGLLFSKGTFNTQAKMTQYGRKLSTKVPLWIALDGEWGLAMRLTDAIKFPRNGALGTIRPEVRDSLMYEYGKEVARQCRLLGININFAPVLDINSNPNNPVIGNRSFGHSVWEVVPPALSYCRGLEEGGVMAVAKHFPGHGDTDTDSHKTLPLLKHDELRMLSFECEPFRYFAKAGFGGMMMAHLEVPSLEPQAGLPSSLSHAIVTDLLQKQLGFNGLVFTDGLAMKGVNNIANYSVKALLAGVDVLLDPVPLQSQWKSLKQALADGSLPQSLVDEKCRKVLRWKYVLCVMQPDLFDTKNLAQRINTPQATALRETLNQEVALAKTLPRTSADSTLNFDYDPTEQGLPVQATAAQAAKAAQATPTAAQASVTLQQLADENKKQIKNPKFHRVDSLVQDALDKDAFPGCQILIAHKGQIVYNRAFGWLDYDRTEPNSVETVYDLASLTKITGTLPALMLAYDEYNLKFSDPMSWHVPQLRNTDKKNITLRQALYHESDLRNGYSFYAMTFDTASYNKRYYSGVRKEPFTVQQDKRCWFDKNLRFDTAWISPTRNEVFSLPVANGMYIKPAFRDSIIQKIIDLPLMRPHKYRYSDLNFILIRLLVEQVSHRSIDQYLYEKLPEFYGPGKLCYRPLEQGVPLYRIAPTENDQALRHQQLRGYVHDEAAAWSGGVEGNAGLFGSASDIYPLFQMILDKGKYQGKQLINEITIERMTTQKSHISRRGLGFDKPETNPKKINPCCDECSPQTYGHTGYTGTCVWVDPKKELIFIFLCNRVNPHRWNTTLTSEGYRSRIHSAIYEAIK